MIIRAGSIFTGTPAGTLRDRAIVVEGDRIVAITTFDDASRLAPGARLLDASSLAVLPGLIDAHGHIEGLGLGLDRVDLGGALSEDEVVRRVAARTRTAEPGEWILGRGWDQNDWPSRSYPTASLIDSVAATNPVWLMRIDGHAGLANSTAMRLAGVTRETADPPGGQILRDAGGNPTGVFIDLARDLIQGAIPAASRAQRTRAIRTAVQRVAESGLTEAHDAGVDAEAIAIYRELAARGELPVRVYAMLTDDAALLDEWFAKGPYHDPTGMLTVRSVKLYADGALGSRGAALLEPYSDDPGNRGLVISTPEHMADVSRRAREAGFQVNAHAIGDRGNRNVLDAYEHAGARTEERFRVEHFQVATLEDIERLGRMGVIASMQPTHATSDSPWAERRVGADRIAGAYAWRRVLDSGGRLSLGSDFPVEEVSPLLGLWAATTRGGWRTEERLTISEAIRGFTADAAFAGFEEGSRGTIEPGKLADFTILDRDPEAVDPSELPRLRVRYTIVGGRVVWDGSSK